MFSSIFSCGAAGIEPATEIALTCVVAGIWVRETTRNKRERRTCGDAKGVDGINMPQAYAACCWAAKSREMPQLRTRGIPN
jgi:hypothetical protein